mmetsp:Transcript_17214/g.26976  ORF Transcript_17214/g.26976 Transcript_17214/m.26976 type:complete len:169 (+) Transcript_17214:112-618(+)|eukprot:CAMPEP_0201715596 /NCGR_PEP_ID=MMETSP0593-20130828/1727_1 /ASSEMBLY_ACC=CAM_ASM_000672 /TAXON_ID=267983 /ORGANISM="Skeletonema japonicum, Strain CCMP2506" /LENGTH=168 /DNA_ID=CAMNT_0048205123 /DNA_START=106 /DNA_END=612 /DNA_ORIENTATION=+
MATLTRLIRTLPLPLFGTLQTATTFTLAKSRALPRLAGWVLPLGVGALWFIWPAVDDEWKQEMGFKSDPEAALKAVEEAKAKELAKKTVVELPVEVMAKVEGAYKGEEVDEVTAEEDLMLVKAAGTGDFTYLEEQWEAFNDKAIRPGEDDDDDDDDEDEEEEEEEEEE